MKSFLFFKRIPIFVGFSWYHKIMKGIHNIKRSYELRKFQHYKFKYQETSHYPQTSHDSISTKIDIHEINTTLVFLAL